MKTALYIGGFCMPDGNAAAQRVLGVAKVLRDCEYNVRFSGLTRLAKAPENGIIDGFSYINYPYPDSFRSWIRYLLGQDNSITEIKAFKPDLVILYNHPAFAIERITKYCHNNGIKVLADVTEWYEAKGSLLFRMIKGYDTNRRMLKSHLKVDGLICISSYLTKFYKQHGVKVIEIPPLVDIEQPKWHQNIESKTNEIRLVYAGSPGSSKDRLDLILDALDEIIPTLNKDVKFDIFGITQEQYIKTWGDESHRDYVVFNGHRPHEEVIKKLLEADFQIFLRPDTLTSRAGFPTKFVETITSGTLPITNLSSNLEDYLTDGVTGFVISRLEKRFIMDTIRKALSKTTADLDYMKLKLDNETFDFRKYGMSLSAFIDLL